MSNIFRIFHWEDKKEIVCMEKVKKLILISSSYNSKVNIDSDPI